MAKVKCISWASLLSPSSSPPVASQTSGGWYGKVTWGGSTSPLNCREEKYKVHTNTI